MYLSEMLQIIAASDMLFLISVILCFRSPLKELVESQTKLVNGPG